MGLERDLKDYLAFDQIIACCGTWLAKAALIIEDRFDKLPSLSKRSSKPLNQSNQKTNPFQEREMSHTEMLSVLTDFDLHTGLSKNKKPMHRHLSQMKGMYADDDAFNDILSQEDPLVYDFFDMGVPESEKEIAYGTSITYSGKVGDEYYMTKGHFHTVIDTAEVYYCLRGNGYMLMENPEGSWEARELTPGKAVYVPPRFAHRSINVSTEDPLITFFAFPGHAGHDYGSIETQGFRKLLVERNGQPVFIDNPKWKKVP